MKFDPSAPVPKGTRFFEAGDAPLIMSPSGELFWAITGVRVPIGRLDSDGVALSEPEFRELFSRTSREARAS